MGDKPCVLVVDDEPDVLELLRDVLETRGFEVIGAAGGVEALSQVEKYHPRAVLLDVRMPQMSGVDVLRRLRTDHPDVAVLMMSGNDDLETARQAIELGAYDCILKPFDLEYVERAVRAMLAGAPSARQRAASEPAIEPMPEASPQNLMYELALAVFKVTRGLPPESRASLGTALETAALGAAQRGTTGEKADVVRALNHVRMLLRFARDLGDLSDEQHRSLESHVVRARRSIGLS